MRGGIAARRAVGERQELRDREFAGRRIELHRERQNIAGRIGVVAADIGIDLVGRNGNQHDVVDRIVAVRIGDRKIGRHFGRADRGGGTAPILQNELVFRGGTGTVGAELDVLEKAGNAALAGAEGAGFRRLVGRGAGLRVGRIGADGFVQRDLHACLGRHFQRRAVVIDADGHGMVDRIAVGILGDEAEIDLDLVLERKVGTWRIRIVGIGMIDRRLQRKADRAVGLIDGQHQNLGLAGLADELAGRRIPGEDHIDAVRFQRREGGARRILEHDLGGIEGDAARAVGAEIDAERLVAEADPGAAIAVAGAAGQTARQRRAAIGAVFIDHPVDFAGDGGTVVADRYIERGFGEIAVVIGGADGHRLALVAARDQNLVDQQPGVDIGVTLVHRAEPDLDRAGHGEIEGEDQIAGFLRPGETAGRAAMRGARLADIGQTDDFVADHDESEILEIGAAVAALAAVALAFEEIEARRHPVAFGHVDHLPNGAAIGGIFGTVAGIAVIGGRI